MSKELNTGYLISPIQRRLWYLAELEGSQSYRVQGEVRIEGELDRVRLSRAVEAVLGRHEALRTTLQMLPGISIPVQVVGDERGNRFDIDGERDVCASAKEEASAVDGGLRLALVRESARGHWLRISAPSVVLDEVSVHLVAHEIAELYAFDGNRELLSAPGEPLQYPDVSEWLNEAAQAADAAAGRRFWRDGVSGFSSSLRYLRKEERGRFGVESLKVDLGIETAAKILAGETEGLWSTSVFLLSAWAVLLQKLGYQTDAVIAAGVDGRSDETLAGVVGPLTRYLPVSFETSRSDRFVDLQARAAGVLSQAAGWQECFSWETAAEEKSEEARAVYVPFAFDYLQLKALEGGLSVRFRLEGSSGCMERFDLKLSCRQKGERLHLYLHWNTGSYRREEIERVAQSLHALLQQAADHPEIELRDLEVVGRDQKRRLLEEFNQTAAVYAGETLIHEQFAEQVKRTPHAEALRYEAHSLTYEELERRAEQLAAYLNARGVGPESLVGICLQRSIEMVIAVLGVLKAGGAYVPLDPGYPQARLEYMLRCSGVRLVVSNQEAEERLPDVSGIEVVRLHGAEGTGSTETRPQGRRGKATNANPAYVIYTSGSTGDPKGVVISHGAIRNHMAWMLGAFPLSATDRVLQKTAFSFDASVWEFYAPLLTGGCLVMARPGGQQDAEYLAQCIEQEGITVLQLVPSQLRMLLAERLDHCTALRRVYCGGEALEQEAVNAFYRQLPAARLFNLYGPTETTIDAAWAECHAEKQDEGTASIGRGIANTRLYVLDEDQNLAPIGVAGQLYIGGAGVARGYLNWPELTAERFVPDPFAGNGGERLYRTGDLVRWSGDGTLEFLGRNDSQIKVRGYRIELGEIETRLSQHPGLNEAAVLARDANAGGKQLVAYYTAKAGSAGDELSEAELGAEPLRAYMLEKLPEYMVPSAYVRLKQMPLTANGKLDRKALPAPEEDAYALHRYQAPRGQVESALAAIWSAALKLEQVGREDNFFEIGGHSLLAMLVMSRIRKTFGVQLPLRMLFESPTIAGLAARIEEEDRKVSRIELPAIERVSRQQRLPLSFAQKGLWFLAQMEGASKAYHMTRALRLMGPLHVPALRQALHRIAVRHEVLRTSFAFIEGEPVQQICAVEASSFHLLEHDLVQCQNKEKELERVVAEEADTAFNLETGPLIRGRLIRLEEREHAFLLTMHHIVSDGWSMGVLNRELEVLYGAYVREQEDPLPPLEIQFAEYAVWQQKWMGGEVLQEQAEYWKNTLAGAPALLELPTDSPRPREMDFRGGIVELVLDEQLTQGIKNLSRRNGLTLYMTLLAAWAVVMSRLSGQQEVVIGTPVANRGRSEIEGLIGFFLNMLAIRLDFSGSPRIQELLERVKNQVLAAQERQDIPFEQVVEMIQPVRSMAHSPIVQVVFDWHNTPRESLQLAGVEVRHLSSRPHIVSKYDLNMALSEVGERIVGGVEYAASLFERSTVERYLECFRSVLQAMVADDSQRLECLPLMPATQREQVLTGWNSTAVEYGAQACMHELFERQAERTPDRIAAVYEGQEVSYRELEERANRVGNYLTKLGVGPEVRVGICVARSLEMVVGILGILKAGGAYVPLDQTYPVERLRYMLADARASVVLTQTTLLDKLQAIEASVVCLDQQWEEIASEPGTRPLSGVNPENLAYIYYTSGSTGRPKGVAMAHSGIVNYIHWGIDGYQAAAGSGAPVFSSIAVDLTLTNFLPLFVGEPMVLAADSPGVEALVELMQRKPQWSLLKLTPTHLTLLNSRLTVEEMRHCTQVLVIGADNLVAEPTLVWREQAPGVNLLNEYGPTETVVGCSIYRIGEGSPRHGAMPIGKPIANITMYVLDKHGEPLPVGVPGELFIGGIGVARGYWGRPELTAEKFVPDIFAAREGARFYRTGDRARFLEDGNLEFLGRVDHQVKIRGYRIEPEEVEAVLSGCPGVKKALVVVREDVPGEKRLVGYVAASDVQASELRAYLKDRLPDYMVPAAWVIMDELPVGSTGKINAKQALPPPDAAAYLMQEYEAPRGPVEEALAEIWSELLGVERIGRNDNFFELGGHSLLAVRVMARLRQRLGLKVAITDIFTHPGLSELAASVQGSVRTELPPITGVERNGSLPLSLAQQRLWFLTQMEGTSDTSHVALAMGLTGRLDLEALRRALDRIVVRHETLRTRFVAIDGQPEQRITAAEESCFQLLQQDLRGHTQVDKELERLAKEEFSTAFNVETGPLVRGRLIRLAEEEHALLITMLHIVSDGWSTGVLYRELGALYGAYLRQEEDPLPPLKVQYVDYAVWQRTWMEGEILQHQGEYWRSTLAGAPSLLELPGDHPRPLQANYDGAWVNVVLSEELTARLKELSRRQGTTLYMTVLAGWMLLMSRLSGQTDVVVGTHYANRGHVEIENLIGFFVNNLPLRVDVGGGATVAELLARVKEQALGAQRNSEIPFEQVVEIISPERSLSHNPIFQVMLAWQNEPGAELRLPGIESRAISAGARTEAKVDLALTLRQEAGKIVGGFVYAKALFEHATIERYLGYFQTLLEGISADDSQVVDRLPWVPAVEREQVLYGWNRTARQFPGTRCVHELFADQVARTPELVAVVYEDQQLTYGELNRRSNRLAHYLRELGVGPDARVCICVDRGLEMIEAVLGVLKAGGAYVPLDPAHPEQRLQFMLEDSQPYLVLTQAHLRDQVQDLSGMVLVVDLNNDEDWRERPDENPTAVVAGLNLNHMAYMIYTSGSTGQPKGVMVEHGAWSNLISRQLACLQMKPSDRMLQFVSFSFDAWGEAAMETLCAGASLYLLSSAVAAELDSLLEVAERYAMTHLFLPAPVLSKLAQQAGAVSARTVTTGGDLLSSETARHWGRGRRLMNEYGPTEATVSATSYEYREEETTDPPIGRPIANAHVYLLDSNGDPVPLGVVGEIYIGGAGVARGYWARAALTAERFLPDPIGRRAGARLYRTGDLGRWRADGNIEFVGRNDGQVKIRGYRIELGEIEARLAEQEGIREAAVIAREDQAGEKRLVAYYTAKEQAEGEAIRAEELRRQIAKKLPEYMVPAAYVRLEKMPITASGKLDRQALPAPEGDEYAVRAYEAPLGPVEQTLAEIWSELLGVERVGRNDNFFELGGHSLLVVRVMARTQQWLGVEIGITDLFIHPLLSDFAASVENSVRTKLPPITPARRSTHLPLSLAQQRLWFLAHMDGASETYHIPLAMSLKGELDRRALWRALDRLVARHEALRTTFIAVDGEPVQRFSPVEESGFQLLQQDLRAFSEVEPELKRVVAEEGSASFDLETGPLIRGRLIRVGEAEHALLITMHHIVSDGWSIGVLLRELSALYEAFLHGQEDPVPELAVQYADYAVWQRTWMEQGVLAHQAEYWKTTLAAAPALLELPWDHARPAETNYAGDFVGLVLDKDLTRKLKAVSRAHGATLFMTLLAGWGAVLARLSGQQEVVIGTPVANRGRSEIEGLIGFFLNMLAIRIDVSGAPTAGELIERVKRQALAAQENQDIPFEQVVEIVRPARSMSHTPVFQVMFAWQNALDAKLQLPGLKVEPLPSVDMTAKFDLELGLREQGDSIVGGATYATSLFERATVERYLGYFRRQLEAMVPGENQVYNRLSLMDATERKQVLHEWNATAREYPANRCAHELFEEHAESRPAAVAAVYEDQQLTYAELNRRANRLADYLRGLGVKAEERVGVCVNRGLETVVALLGVLKAGGVYVPLDPEYPAERLAFMLNDSAPAVLLTEGYLQPRLSRLTDGIPVVEITDAVRRGKSESNPAAGLFRVDPDHLAYVIYTSGSTGVPKGVAVGHRGLAARLTGVRQSLAFGPEDTMPKVSSTAFDISLLELMLPLISGGQTRISDGPRIRDMEYLMEQTQTATVFNAVTSLMDAWRQWAAEKEQASGLRRLRMLLVGGEPVSQRLLDGLREQFPQAEVVETYGPTEAALYSTSCRGCDGRQGASPPIGRPLANTQVYILDENAEPVPVGVVGELYIGGVAVARGYLTRAELTAERFVCDPFAPEGGARLYRTGDLGRWRADGNIEFVGRNDGQVKIRGYRIELGEIEACLAEQEGIREAAVIAREDQAGEKRLLAYYTLTEQTEAEAIRAEELRRRIAKKLPEYMLPAAYVRLEKMPLTASGKLDRQALPAPEGDEYAVRAYEAPLGPVEQTLAEIWSELLGVQRIGRNDNFFELGGHSLLAMRVMARLRQRLGLEVDLKTLYSAATLASLAADASPEVQILEIPPNRIPAIKTTPDQSSSDIEITV